MTQEIVKQHLCIGCGLCASICGKVQMEETAKGFYVAKQIMPLTQDESQRIRQTCPAIKEEVPEEGGYWGKLRMTVAAWSADKAIRHHAASGGVVTALALHLLESGRVDAVLQVGIKKDDYLHNELKISRTREDILESAQSRYAPCMTLVNLKQILDCTEDRFAFVGKPCDIVGVKNFLTIYPQYKSRIVCTIAIFCASMPSYNASKKAWRMSGRTDEPKDLRYRGNGWPGDFCATWEDGSEFRLSYDDSWGKVLGRDVAFRCKICPDGIGLLADVSVGDAWTLKDGKPNFEEQEGRSVVMIRTEVGEQVWQDAKEQGAIVEVQFDLQSLQMVQPYQYIRRQQMGWRMLPVQIKTGWLMDFKGLQIRKLAIMANPLMAIKMFVGMIKRMMML